MEKILTTYIGLGPHMGNKIKHSCRLVKILIETKQSIETNLSHC